MKYAMERYAFSDELKFLFQWTRRFEATHQLRVAVLLTTDWDVRLGVEGSEPVAFPSIQAAIGWLAERTLGVRSALT